ncbi:redoxin domain-containing protein [Pseudohongiella spirulinae]|uniref:Cytochrome c domain-containing protein n=1 Tax=Pseudohongiella spirulinae TaxID=1249552 RepID=A0A0S2KB30_9GAMM|nr:redoxin domain-containing protein [Pseudohongiella spirulinae]ALO45315.1 hypothetical protein PS2015_632 [Pseudohongiella spirulinae]
MKTVIRLACLICTAAALSLLHAGERVGDFALIDHNGYQHHMAWYDDHDAVVILPQAVGATDQASLSALQSLYNQYADQGVAFFLINPGLQTDRQAVADAIPNVPIPVLMDDAQLVSEALGLTHMDQAVVYDPASFEVVYRGPVQAQLEEALLALRADESVELVEIAGQQTPIAYGGIDGSAVSYQDDIAPIIAENCAECHRSGGIAPFAMDSKLSVQGWSPMIREVVMTKRMPPGQIDNKVGHKILNEMNLSDQDMQTLVRWVNAGASIDDSEADPLTELVWSDTKWKMGTPDLIIKVPPQTIPATGVVDYMDIPIDLGLTEDRWVKGSEVAPGAPEVLHHIITTVVPPEGRSDPQTAFIQAINSLPEERAAAIRAQMFAAAAAGQQPDIDRIFRENPDIDVGVLLGGGDADQASVAGYAPGNSVSWNPDGVGGLLRAGSGLSLQMHYTTTGKEMTDATEIGIYFYPEGEVPAERMSGGVGNAFTISIPPHAKDHEMELVTYIPEEAEIRSLMPHMHFRGKRMKFIAQYPDGEEELLLSVPAYSFNWQLSHELAEPLRVPAGTKIIARGAFDNSAQNRFNPDPNTEVNWGEQSWEEMFMGFYEWKLVSQNN